MPAIEPAGGQDSDPPDLKLAVKVAIRFLRDVQPGLEVDPDLRGRARALLHVFQRLRDHLEGDSP